MSFEQFALSWILLSIVSLIFQIWHFIIYRKTSDERVFFENERNTLSNNLKYAIRETDYWRAEAIKKEPPTPGGAGE